MTRLLSRPPAIGATELQSRREALRAAMRHMQIDALLCSDIDDIAYLTGARTGGLLQLALIVPLEGEPLFVGREVDADRYGRATGSATTVGYSDAGDPTAAIAAALRTVLGKGGALGWQAGGWSIEPRVALKLQGLLPDLRWTDATFLVARLAARKSAAELALMRHAAVLGDRAFEDLTGLVRSGVGKWQVQAELYRALLARGSEGMVGTVDAGVQDRTESNGHRPLTDGHWLSFEYSAAIDTYHAPRMRAFSIGALPGRIGAMYDGCRAAFDKATTRMRAGMSAGEVDDIVTAELARRDLAQYHPFRSGYLAGASLTGSWCKGHVLSLARGTAAPLDVDMTFHMLVMLVSPGMPPVGFSDTVRILPDGVEILGSLP